MQNMKLSKCQKRFPVMMTEMFAARAEDSWNEKFTGMKSVF